MEKQFYTHLEEKRPKFLDMYDVSGQDKITHLRFQKYQRDKRKNDPLIEQIIQERKTAYQNDQEVDWAHFDIKRLTLEIFSTAPDSVKASLIVRGLNDSDPYIQRTAAGLILFYPSENKDSLKDLVFQKVIEGFDSFDFEAQIYAAEMVVAAPRDKVALLVIKGLDHPNPYVKEAICKFGLPLVDMDDVAVLQKDIANKVTIGLESHDSNIQESSANMIQFCGILDNEGLVENALEHINPVVQEISARLIQNIDINLKAGFVEKGIDHPNWNVKRIAAQSISHCREAAKDRLQDQVLRYVDLGLKNPDPNIQKIAAEMILYAPKFQRTDRVVRGINSNNIYVQEAAIQSIASVPDSERGELINLVIKKDLFETLIQSQLYKDYDLDNDNFDRVDFKKTGSKTLPLGGGLKDKVIMREIDPESFVAWQKAYEQHEVWKSMGFEYVPIEPIVGFGITNDKNIQVYSGVLDLNCNKWFEFTINKHLSSLLNKISLISNVLKTMRISHGHINMGNFCLRFYRDSEGRIDSTREPRIYLIDFDAARIF
jgi:HEAT repeat protein